MGMDYRRMIAALFAALTVGWTAFGIDLQSSARRREPAETRPDACAVAVAHYEVGDIADREILKAFQELAEAGDVRGKMWIARFYNMGRATLPKQPEVAQEMAKGVFAAVVELAEKNNVEAQFLLGAAYHQGLGVEPDFERAALWYGRAVKNGHVTSMNNLATMVALGHGVEPDITRARRLFLRAIEGGSKLASNNYAKFSDDERDDRGRLEGLRNVALVRALGMKQDPGIAYLQRTELIADAEACTVRD